MRPLQLLPLLLVLSFALAGCATQEAPPTTTSPPAKQYEDGVSRIDLPTLPREAPAEGERTLAAAPQWRLGEWWTYTLTDHFTGRAIETTRVVAGTDGPHYLVGFPIEKFDNDVLIFHIPGFGDVRQDDLSYEVHDVPFAPLRFPLTEASTWPTSFEGRAGNMTAEPQADGTALLTGGGLGWSITAVYDPKVGEITRLDYPGYVSYEVTGHGYGYTGVVRVPHAHDLVFMHGRLGPASDTREGLGPDGIKAESDVVQVPPGYDHLGFTLIVANVAPFLVGGVPSALGLPLPADVPNPAQGYYSAKATAPNGTAYELVALPGSAGTQIEFFGTGDPTGPWTLSFTVGGPGIAIAEGIGYHSIDVQLPSGCVVASFNANHHAAPCKVDGQGGLTA
ncbi:MAG TPA: hypothetical protein VHI93_02430 [Candidatus Thermoplasmatota archaeon]|nr:hypothetical protein [Candidatus Thermoplasmatota archaeon]